MTAAALLLLAVAAPPPRVAAVRLDLPPAQRERLARYLELRPGEPLRPEAVRHAVELLFATGEFADVLVVRTDGPAGVELLFRPVRAPLLQEVAVLGDLVIDADEARRLARLSEKEPLWRPRLERAAADLAAALRQRGYLQAAVEAEARPHPEGAEAVFTVKAGPLVRVRQLEIVGVGGGLRSFLLGHAEPDRGEVFERGRGDQAAARMRKELVARGHWRAQVVARERPFAQEAVDLSFEVTAGPRVAVEFSGARVPSGVRRTVLSLLREGGLESDVADEAADRLEEDLRRRGYRQAHVEREQRSRGAEEVLVFRLVDGPLSRVALVRVEGLPVAVPALLTRPRDPLVDALLEEDQKRLVRALEAEGYGQGEVEVEAAASGGEVPVVFRVRPGPRTLVKEVRLQSPVPLPEAPARAARELHLQPGRPFRARDLAKDREALLALLRDAGHLQAEVTPEVALSEDHREARVVLRATPGPQVTVDHVVIAGLEQTREDVVRREMLLREGEPLGDTRVLETQQRLGALGLFSRVSLVEMDPESLPRRTVVVNAREAPPVTVAYGIGYAERDQVRGSVEVTRKNLFGMDRSVSAFARASFRGSRFLATFREPYLFGRRQELFVTAFREEEDRPAFDFVRGGALLQTARSGPGGLSFILRYAYQLTDTFDVVDPDEVGREFASSTLSGPSVSLVHDTRDDPFDPRRGRFLSADVQLSHSVLGGDSFVKGFLQAAHYQRLGASLVLAVGGRLGLARTFGLGEGILLPRPDRFYAGGDYSLRGFPVDGVLPAGGNGLLLGGAELRLDLGRHFSTAVFADAGNVYPLVRDLDLADLRYAAGVGLRYRSALGPLRVDWGYKLDRRPGEDPHRLHFTVGHAF